jgi:hypothetical protein
MTSAIERYWSKVDRSGGPDACWPWIGLLNSRGYGRFWHDGKDHLAHRWGYIHRIGPIATERPVLCVLHRCDNPPCQNDRHWFIGTRADNVADMIAKGRDKAPPPPPLGNFRRFGIRDSEWRTA